MSTPEAATIANPPTPVVGPGKRGRKRLLLGLGVAVVLVGGGGYLGWSSGMLGFGRAPAAAKSGPKLNIDPDSDAAHPRYKTSYLKIDGAFTTNLRNSARFVQVEIGVATSYDPVVLARVQTHEIPIRSAVLAVLAQQDEAAMTSADGRAALETRLRASINHVLVQKEGFGGVSDVYLTGLVIQ